MLCGTLRYEPLLPLNESKGIITRHLAVYDTLH